MKKINAIRSACFFLIYFTFVYKVPTQSLGELSQQVLQENKTIQALEQKVKKAQKSLNEKENKNDELEESKIAKLKNKLYKLNAQLGNKKSQKNTLNEELDEIRYANELGDELESKYQRGNFYFHFMFGLNLGDFTGNVLPLPRSTTKLFLNTGVSVGYKLWYVILYGNFFVQGTLLDFSLNATYTPLSSQAAPAREATLTRQYDQWIFNYAIGLGAKFLFGKSGFYFTAEFHPVSYFSSLIVTSDNFDNFCMSNLLGQSARQACDRLATMVNQRSVTLRSISALASLGYSPWSEDPEQGYAIEIFSYVTNFQNMDIFYGARVGYYYF